MLPNARKKFRFQVQPSDRQLWAIGMVAVQWTGIEFMLTSCAQGLTDDGEPERTKLDSTRAMDARLDQFEELVKKRVLPDWQKRLLELTNEARQVKELRDKIVHGMWGSKQNSSAEETDAHGAFRWGKPQVPFNWKLDYGSILKVALRIDGLQYQLMSFSFDANGGDKGQGVLLGGSLKKIMVPR